MFSRWSRQARLQILLPIKNAKMVYQLSGEWFVVSGFQLRQFYICFVYCSLGSIIYIYLWVYIATASRQQTLKCLIIQISLPLTLAPWETLIHRWTLRWTKAAAATINRVTLARGVTMTLLLTSHSEEPWKTWSIFVPFNAQCSLCIIVVAWYKRVTSR